MADGLVSPFCVCRTGLQKTSTLSGNLTTGLENFLWNMYAKHTWGVRRVPLLKFSGSGAPTLPHFFEACCRRQVTIALHFHTLLKFFSSQYISRTKYCFVSCTNISKLMEFIRYKGMDNGLEITHSHTQHLKLQMAVISWRLLTDGFYSFDSACILKLLWSATQKCKYYRYEKSSPPPFFFLNVKLALYKL